MQCGTFSTTIIIEQYDIIGHCAVYVSLTIINPGPLSPTTEVFRNETVNVSRRRLIITAGTGRVNYIEHTAMSCEPTVALQQCFKICMYRTTNYD